MIHLLIFYKFKHLLINYLKQCYFRHFTSNSIQLSLYFLIRKNLKILNSFVFKDYFKILDFTMIQLYFISHFNPNLLKSTFKQPKCFEVFNELKVFSYKHSDLDFMINFRNLNFLPLP